MITVNYDHPPAVPVNTLDLVPTIMILTLIIGATLLAVTNAGISLGPCGPKPPTASEFNVEKVLVC